MSAHSHDHSHHHHGDGPIATAFFLNLGFTIIEIIGGILTNSVAIQSDALHDMGDSISLGLAWYFQKLSKKGRTKDFTFGYKRFNTLGAIITGVILAAGSVYILMESIPRLFQPEQTDVKGMIWLALLGVFINGLAVLRLRTQGHSLNERMISWHLIEDVLGWIVVLIGSIAMYFFDVPWLDPAMSIGITLYILYNVIINLWKTFKIILEATPDHINTDQLKSAVENIPGVDDIHHIHIWTLDGEYHLLSAHIVTSKYHTLDDISPIRKAIQKLLHDDFHIEHITLEFEVEDECKEALGKHEH
jgi:cobalt-zinc-cadmium efflux system protein